jgi:hypothetical protein
MMPSGQAGLNMPPSEGNNPYLMATRISKF